MSKLQFRVLYREFLFRVVDLELLSPQGDIVKLLGQFASVLIFFSLVLAFGVLLVAGNQMQLEVGLLFAWIEEHFLISITMLVVGLFAVLSWESAFPDRRDVLVLAPLPVQARTLFLAKVAGVATALGVAVAALNIFTGLAAPLVFASAPVAPPATYDPAMAAVDVAEMQTVLDRDLIPALTAPNGALAPGTKAGVSIGILEHGVRKVLTYGTAKRDSVFEIGSISKTFTGLLLAKMAAQGRVTLDEPIRELLPPGTVAKPKGDEITLLDLITHHSGLPRMPDNFHPADALNPYADYHAGNLYGYLGSHGVARPAGASFLYSNLGVGLLGQGLANLAGTTYWDLLGQEITGPLGMTDTAVVLTTEQRQRLIQSYSAGHRALPPWDLDAFAGAGAIRSTAGDMLTYLETQLHPERLDSDMLRQAVNQSHVLRADVSPKMRIALAWMFDPDTGNYGHDGAIAGFASSLFFNPKGDYAGVVLFNTQNEFPGLLGEHIYQRLAGLPAVSLVNSVTPGKGGVLGVLRSFAAYWITMVSAGIFMFSCVLSVQGLAQLLPRQQFLRVSSLLQMAFFVGLLVLYFLQPPFADPNALAENQTVVTWLPSYWFFGMFQQLSGPVRPELAMLAKRAWMGLGISVCGAGAAYLICYCRTLRMIVEQPDILPSSRRQHWLPRFGGSLETAIGQFSLRTLVRSRQHRVILSFYLGIALGLAIFFSNAPILHQQQPATDVWYHLNAPLLVASILMMFAAVIGTRVVFSMPLELRANWIFRVVPLPGAPGCLSAIRRSLYVLAILPTWTILAVTLFSLWPWRAAAGHVLLLGLFAIIASELCLYGFEKIPFTCSYRPAKTHFQMASLSCLIFNVMIFKVAALEREALDRFSEYALIAGILVLAAILAGWLTWSRAKSVEAVMQFEDLETPTIQGLGLHRDGGLPLEPEHASG